MPLFMAQALSAGRRITAHWFSMVLLAALVINVGCAPVANHRHSIRFRHHPRSPVTFQRREQGPDPNGFTSPDHPLFWVFVVTIVHSCVGFIVVTILILRCVFDIRASKTADDTATVKSFGDKDSLGRSDSMNLNKPPKVYPAMSSVLRGTSSRFNQRSVPLQVDDVMAASPMMQSQDMSFANGIRPVSFLSDGSSTFSLDAKDTDDARQLRQSDLARPSVTRGTDEWHIHMSEMEENDESFEKPIQLGVAH